MFQRLSLAFDRWRARDISETLVSSLLATLLFAVFERDEAAEQWLQLLVYPAVAAIVVGITRRITEVHFEALGAENWLALAWLDALPGFARPATDRHLLDRFLRSVPRGALSRESLHGPMRGRTARIAYVADSDPQVEARVAILSDNLFSILLSQDVRVIRPYTRFGRETAYYYDRRRLRFLLRLHAAAPPSKPLF